jgi:AcrR family transcriptional regulator
MPRSAEQFEEMREESRERLLESALALFAEHGYAATPIRRIAEHAGVSQGLMYNYFAGKEQLLLAIFERGMSDVQTSLARAQAGATPRERLASLIRESVRIVREHEHFWRLSYGLRFQPRVAEGLGDAVVGWSAAIRRQLEELLGAARMPDAATQARILFATIDGVAQHYVLDPAGYPLERVVAALIERYAGPAGSARIHPPPNHGDPDAEPTVA